MRKKIITTEKAPGAVGPYSQGVQFQDLLFISGQLPIDVQTGTLLNGDIKMQTRQSIKNIEAICCRAGATLKDVLKTTIYVQDLSFFEDINEAYGEFFAETPPARSCVEVASLPKNAKLEIEAIVSIQGDA